MEGKICPIYCFCYAARGVHCGVGYRTTIYLLLLLRSIIIHWVGENIIFNNQPGRVGSSYRMHGGVRDGSLIMISSMYWIVPHTTHD